jgi:hypothetical protein
VLTATAVLPESVTIVLLDRPFVHGRAPVFLNGKWGFIDPAGGLVIQPVFAEAKPFCPDGLAPVRKEPDSGWSFIDTEGREIVSLPSYPEPQNLGCFSEGLLAVSSENYDDSFFMDRRGQIVIRGFSRVTSFSEGLAAVQVDRDGLWGYIDRDGVLRILPQFQWAEPFSDGRAMVVVGDEHGYIDRDGRMVVAPLFRHARSYREKRAVVMHPAGWTHEFGMIDASGTFITRERYRRLWDLSEGLAFFLTGDGRSGYLNARGEPVIDLSGASGRSFSEGLAAASREGKWGYVDRRGQWIIAPQYDDTDRFSEGKAAVRLGDEIRYIDKSGKVLWKSAPVEAELRAEAARKREEKRRATSTAVPDRYGDRSAEELFRLLIGESRLDVLPTLIKTVPVEKLVGEVHRRLPASPPERPAQWVVEHENERQPLSTGIDDLQQSGDGTLHLLLRDSFVADGPDYLGNKQRQYSELVLAKRVDGRWTSAPFRAPLHVGEARLMLHPDGSSSILFQAGNNTPSQVDGVRPGNGQLYYAEEGANGWTHRKLLALAVAMMHGFDACRTAEGAWQVAWAPWESNDVDQAILIAPLTQGHLDPEVVIRRPGYDLTEPHWVECGKTLAAVSQVSDGGKAALMLYHVSDPPGESRRRPDQRPSNGHTLQDDIDLGLAASSTNRTLLAALDAEAVVPFALAPQVERLPSFQTHLRFPSDMGQKPALIELPDGEPALLMPYEGTAVLIKAGPSGSLAAALRLPGEGRLILGPPLRSGETMHLAFSRLEERGVRVGVVEIALASLQWAPLANVLINATPAVSAPPGENFLIKTLSNQARALYDSKHWPAAADIYARLISGRANLYESGQILREICEVHVDLAACSGYAPH